MKDARKYVEPGDLVAVHTKFSSTAAICKKWTDSSFQFFVIKDYKNLRYSNLDSPQEVKEKVKNRSWITWTSYIRARTGRRVVPIKKSNLNDYEQAYYEVLKERLNL